MFSYQDDYVQFIIFVGVLCLNHLTFGKGFWTCQHPGMNTIGQDSTAVIQSDLVTKVNKECKMKVLSEAQP